MATESPGRISNYPTQQYSASEFVESCGAVPFLLSKRQIYLVNNIAKDEWLLAKGRRDCNETRRDAAIREIREETGLRCQLLPVKMATRAPGPGEDPNVEDNARVYENIVEPFMYTLRQLPKNEGFKIIFWYIATVDEENSFANEGEETFSLAAFPYDEAVDKLTYENDKEIVKRAIEIVEENQIET